MSSAKLPLAYRWFLNNGVPLRGEHGQVVGWCVLLTDIDEQKRAEDAVRESERPFRLLVETIPALVWRGTPEGELDYLNQRAVDYLGHTAGDWFIRVFAQRIQVCAGSQAMIARLGGDTSQFVSKKVFERLKAKFKKD